MNLMHTLRRDAVTCALALLALLGLEAVERFGVGRRPIVSAVQELVRTAQNRGLNQEAREALTGGYYEGLLNEGSRVSSMNALITGPRTTEWTTGAVRPERRIRKDFLYYDYPPGLDLPDYEDTRLRLVTNSHGLADVEYAVERPLHTRRIAVLGDSITRGQGAPFGTSYEALLEERLNERHLRQGLQRYELLNFSVSGYRITQTVEVALEKVPPFKPDVYMVALSDLSVFRQWGHHLGQLIHDGIDLKYPFLKQLARDARLSQSDPIGTIDAKLARYRLPTIRWVLTEIRAQAARDGAELLVVLVPTVTDPKELQEDFLGVREILADLDITTIDLLGTFTGIEDLNPYRVTEKNRHPNELGHRRLFDELYRQVVAEPAIMSKLTGMEQRGSKGRE